MKHRSIFIEVLVRRFVRATRARISPTPIIRAPFFRSARRRTCAIAYSQKLAALCLIFIARLAVAAVQEIGPIGITVGDLDRELFFYTNTLTFQLVSVSEADGPQQSSLLGLEDVRIRTATLRLGAERITLTQHFGNPGKPVPQDSRSFDRWFQHIAIVVRDMDAAYDQLHKAKIKYVSTSPQTLPQWNKNASGIKAFYFRDPEDHVLEIIWFPAGKGDPKWQISSASKLDERPLFLGIDHTAIVVSDTDQSLAFYRDLLGLRVAGESENYGDEQEHLNQVFGARLRITALRAGQGPGIEFLEYVTPPGGRSLSADASARDLVFWNTHLMVDQFSKFKTFLSDHGVRTVSRSGYLPSLIIRDPDGHALQLDGIGAQSAAAAH